MARVSDNALTTGLRGRVGKFFVFRVINGKTFASHAPRKPDKSKETVAQRQTRTNFRDATRWAKLELLDPGKKKYYQQKAKKWGLTNGYIAAIKEYMGGLVREAKNANIEQGPDSYQEAINEFRSGMRTPNIEYRTFNNVMSSFKDSERLGTAESR